MFKRKKKKTSKQSSETVSVDKPETPKESVKELEAEIKKQDEAIQAMKEGRDDDVTAKSVVSSAQAMMDSSVMADIERLKAQAEANNELRQFFSEKFSRIDEEIGELRNQIVDSQKDMHELEVKAIKASDLVEEVHPEKLMVEMKKIDARVEALNAKIDAHEEVNESIIEELKDVRNSMRTFRGIEELKKMNKELLEDQTVIKKIEGNIEQHSDKVEAMFGELSKKYDDFRNMKAKASEMEDSFNTMKAEFEGVKVKVANVAQKTEFDEFAHSIHQVVDPVQNGERAFIASVKQFQALNEKVTPLIIKYTNFETEQKRTAQELTILIDRKSKNYENIILRLQQEKDVALQEIRSASKERETLKKSVENLIHSAPGLERKEVLKQTRDFGKEIEQLKSQVTKIAELLKKVVLEVKTQK